MTDRDVYFIKYFYLIKTLFHVQYKFEIPFIDVINFTGKKIVR